MRANRPDDYPTRVCECHLRPAGNDGPDRHRGLLIAALGFLRFSPDTPALRAPGSILLRETTSARLVPSKIEMIVGRVYGEANMLQEAAVTKKVPLPIRRYKKGRLKIKRTSLIRM